MSTPNISDVTSQLVCDLKDQYPTKAHNSTSKGLLSDPLGENIRICHACYQRRVSEKQSAAGLICAYKEKFPDNLHKITSGGLKIDPLNKIDKICNACYQRRLSEKQSAAGLICAYKEKFPDYLHKITSGGLKIDPLNKIDKICHACYLRRVSEKQSDAGLICSYKEKFPDNLHKITSGILLLDPLNKIDRICNACYQRRVSEKQSAAGLICAYQKKFPEKSHNIASGGLRTDPLYKKDKICNACYLRIRKELKRKCETPSLSDASEDEESDFRAKRPPTASSSGAQERIASTSELDLLAECAAAEQPLLSTIAIKTENVNEDPECVQTGFQSNEHQIDNSLPILQDPINPHRSLLSEEEAPIDSLRVTRWNGLELTKYQKQHVKDQIRQWLHLNETDKPRYAEKLEQYCEVAVAIDEGPSRGRSVFAKKDIEALTVIGPYAGILRRSDKELQQAISQNGSVPTLTYLFGTSSLERSIDALHHGNVTSLVNTGSMPGYKPWAENNIIAINVGKNLIFYIAKEKIDKGQELLLDYGPIYNPYQYIKQEKENT